MGRDRVICKGWMVEPFVLPQNVAHGTLLLISSQAVAVPMEDTLALGADDWMGSNADGSGAPGADGPRVHIDAPRPKET